VPESDEKHSSGRRGDQGTPQRRPQPQPRSQDPAKLQPPSERLHQKAVSESVKALPSKLPASGRNGKYRPERSGKPLTTADARNRNPTQPVPSLKEPKAATRSSLSRPTTSPPDAMASSRLLRPTPPSPDSGSRAFGRLFLCGLRLLILGVGVSAIAGTLLSVLDPATRITSNSVTPLIQKLQPQAVNPAVVSPSGLKLSHEIRPLKTAVQQLAAKNAGLTPGVFFVDLDTGAYVELNGSSTLAAASTIKFPVIVAFFQDVDAGKIHLDEMLSVEPKLIGGGSGEMQYQPPGTKFTALDTATKMITISDNTATNMLIARMGGAAALNQRFRSWGLTATQIRNPLPDLPGTNTTSPKDLANLMALVNQGDLISIRSRDRLLDIMRRTTINTLLPPGLGLGATIAHKTGDIGTLVGDVGLVDMPSGKRYIAVTMVKRPYNDSRAQELIRQISRVVYQQFNQPAVAAKTANPLGR